MAIAQDSVGFMWFGTRQGISRYDGHHFKNYLINQKSNKGQLSEEVNTILTDFKGVIWVGTSNGLMSYDVTKDRFETVKSFKGKQVENLCQDVKHNLWIGTLNGLKLMLNKETQSFKTFLFSKNLQDPINRINNIFSIGDEIWLGTGSGLIIFSYQKGVFSAKRVSLNKKNKSAEVTAIAADENQNIWVGTTNGLYQLNNLKKVVRVYFHSENAVNSLIHNDIREIMPTKDGIWIGTQNGLSILNPKLNLFTNYQHDPEVNTSISHNSIHHITKDRNSNIWIGTYFGGVNAIYPVSTYFKFYKNNRSNKSISSNVISSITESENHNLWIATEGGGLNYFDKKLQYFKSYKNNPADVNSISSNLVKMLIIDKYDKANVIIGTHRGMLNILNTKTGKFLRISNVKDDIGTVGSAEIVALAQDETGKIWIGSVNGITNLNRSGGKYATRTTFSNINKFIKNKSVLNLLCDRNKNLWIGTQEGLFRYSLADGKFDNFLADNAKNEIQTAYINCVVESLDGNLIIGTNNNGFSIYDIETKTLKNYQESDGLINNNVLGIVEDENKNLWISTAKGLSEFNTKTKRFRNYTRSDGLAGNEFNIRSYFKDWSGEIFFGGLSGLSSFYPRDIQINKYVSPLVFTGVRLFNKPVDLESEDILLKKHLNFTKELDFNYKQNNFSIEFALLNYVKPDKNKYAYKLDGYDKDWKVTSTPMVSYANLAPGKYKFLVKATNNDGIPGNQIRKLEINVKPAPWFSWWAYLFYVLLFFTILFLTLRYFFVRALFKRAEKDQQMKLSFFTHVSHEIRAPLTLILGPLEALLKQTAHLPEINNQVIPIKNNADRLFRLVTELMDFRKTETGKLKLQLTHEDITHFVQQIFNAFKDLASSRNIKYEMITPDEQLLLWIDKLQLEKVFFNLLSNAFKFTHDNGKISVCIANESDSVLIEVRDNGIGIPQNSRDQLFSDFFQIDTSSSGHIGSGIGLALSKSIVIAHGGIITIDSVPQTKQFTGDTRFKVKLKKDNVKNVTSDYEIISVADRKSSYQAPILLNEELTKTVTTPQFNDTILIVEDNQEIRKLLIDLLAPYYQVIAEENGKAGWETATNILPDLVICDIMMPIMNGLELCSNLKTDDRTAHIPVILLTAMDTLPQQVDGLETGADSYLTKPFSVELLLLHIKNLLQARRIMRKKFTEEVNLQPQEITINKTDHEFMVKVVAFIEKRMTDESFVIPDLATEVGMSQPILYKKIRAITDLSVNEFIKYIRLKRAFALLSTEQYNVSEVSYLVGFNDVKYFSREFKKHYGYSPKQHSQKSNN